eukprot:CAMPEP_0119478526 /NCGR_PEP_ID=MMETSP1344-20130328/8225_1 /TAXON_ID=236787 /ORGANISM="Florenciella parvula, Strain CCMP2471" /LENGTH=94 /DNA_ID=CAMNT_0007512703 /DNA_START=188 /DNA_END=469 /DNA_ORIENTATION=+
MRRAVPLAFSLLAAAPAGALLGGSTAGGRGAVNHRVVRGHGSAFVRRRRAAEATPVVRRYAPEDENDFSAMANSTAAANEGVASRWWPFTDADA